MKVETHNHPTAISPFPGAATGSGGEIRDEGATGRGAKPKAGLVGFSVSNLRIPGFVQPWEQDLGRPDRIASALEIMLEGPIGAAAFNNEFGRPGILGYFRSYEQRVPAEGRPPLRGYHKPIMIAGGLGNIRRSHVEKAPVVAGARIVVLGGPALLIGLGGGAASSVGAGASATELDFASVQRGNPEMQRRAQEVIDACWALADDNPVLLIHDVGAGGLSNAVPESVAQGGTGGRIALRQVPSDEPGMSPLELWCNEAQERYVLVIAAERLAAFGALCERERCPYAVIGEVTGDGQLRVEDERFGNVPVDMALDTLLGKPPRMTRDVRRLPPARDDFDGRDLDLEEAALRLLRLPAIADKTFLVTIGDRSVGGMISRDPMVGPWQVPVSDVAVTIADYFSTRGEAMAMGERTPLALIDPAAAGRMAVAEAVTNIAAADIRAIEDIRLSANWMAACGEPGEDADLHDTVYAVGEEFCPALGIAIPVGKDSLSMRTTWRDGSGLQRRRRARVAHRVGLRTGPRRQAHADTAVAHRSGGNARSCSLTSGAGETGSEGRASRRSTAGWAASPPTARSQRCCAPSSQPSAACRRRACCSPTTIARTAACSSRWLRWHLPVIAASRWSCRARMLRCLQRRCTPRNWARCCRCRRVDVERVLGMLEAAGLAGCASVIGRPVAEDRIELRHAGRAALSSHPHGIAQGMVGNQPAHAGAAGPPRLRRRGVRDAQRIPATLACM